MFKEILDNIANLSADLKSDSKKAAETAAKRVLEHSQAYVPVQTGALRASGKISVDSDGVFVEYTESYALDVHENASSPGYKFLERAVQDVDIKRIMIEELKK